MELIRIEVIINRIIKCSIEHYIISRFQNGLHTIAVSSIAYLIFRIQYKIINDSKSSYELFTTYSFAVLKIHTYRVKENNSR